MNGNFWGTLIKNLREERGLSQRSFSVETKVPRSTLRKIESGTWCGEIDSIEKMLLHLGYELEAVQITDQKPDRDIEGLLQSDRRSRLAAARIMTMPLK